LVFEKNAIFSPKIGKKQKIVIVTSPPGRGLRMSLTTAGVPAALKNAMIGPKDVKPFTYLPGGLDFSEIRSPKMAQRLAKQATDADGVNGGEREVRFTIHFHF
jgi:hypothetical protein